MAATAAALQSILTGTRMLQGGVFALIKESGGHFDVAFLYGC